MLAMETAGVPGVRAVRATLALLAVFGVTAAAHQVGGGSPPGPLAFLVLALLLGPVVWVVAGRRLSAGRLLLLLGGAQVAVHAGLVAMAPGRGTGAATHVHGGLPTGLGPASSMAMPMPMTHLDARMLTAHVVATLVLTLVLSRAEAALWHVVSGLLPRVVAPLRRVLVPRLAVPLVLLRPAAAAPRPLGGRAPPLAPA